MTTDTQLAPTDTEIADLWHNSRSNRFEVISFARAALARWGQPAHSVEPVAWAQASIADWRRHQSEKVVKLTREAQHEYGFIQPLYTAQPVERGPLTPREIELIDGMIAVQLDHAMRCDAIANRAMADKQKGWDMERVALLQKFKAAHGSQGGQHGTE